MLAKRKEVHIHSLSPMLSEAIRQCRTARDMSPQDLARKIRQSPGYVGDLEQAKIAITSQTLEDCAAAFGLSVGELVEIAVSERVLLVAHSTSLNRKHSNKSCI